MKKAFVINILILLSLGSTVGFSQSVPVPVTNAIQIVELQGRVQILPAGTTTWQTASNNEILFPADQLRTAGNSRVAVHWSDQSIITFGASTAIEILPPPAADGQTGLHLLRGILSFFHRDEPGRIRIITRGAVAGVEGTEFVMAVNEAEDTTLSVIDGQVRFGDAQNTLLVTSGEQASLRLGQTPVRTAGFIANNLLQWCFYYPAVIDPAELNLSASEQRDLADSLNAYRAGDLLGALKIYPPGRDAISENERIYHGALLLAVGEVAQTETLLQSLSGATNQMRPLADSLSQVIAAVKRQYDVTFANPATASECLAASYLEQSRADRKTSLANALGLAQRAVALSPKFGFAWTRVAELQFSFGRLKEAMTALDAGLELAPQNAQALALKGFILAAQNQPHAAALWFNRAIDQDSALGNAWLGRGLTRIRLGDKAGGRADLLVAAALEPQRAELRSYLGKAFANSGDDLRAEKELALAKKLDPNDPTAWLYSALLNQQNNQINDAIRDLEKSQTLNDNRSVYRSGLLLDQDSAVRSANLATIYQDAVMTEVSVQEASRAVNADYANYSAHLFLASSYAQVLQADPNNSRYEPAVENEYLLANLLAPASAGTLSSTWSQQQHLNLFNQNHLGVFSSTEYLSRGAWTQTGLQYGTYNNFSYGLEEAYQTDPGQRANNDLEKRLITLKLKGQLTPQDSVYAEIQQYEGETGDLGQYYDTRMANTDGRIKNEQTPDLILGYHHEWSPGVDTLLMVRRLDDHTSMNGTVPLTIATRFANLTPDPYELVSVYGGYNIHSAYDNHLTFYTTELQQIWETESHATILGSRLQYGDTRTTNLEDTPSDKAALFDIPAAQQNNRSEFKRYVLYGYHQWQLFDSLKLIGGVSYDLLTQPENLLAPPISVNPDSIAQLSPKAGVIWTPLQNTTVQFAYARTLGDNTPNQSTQLESSQVAGFLQTFRDLISNYSVTQTGVGQDEIFGLSWEQKLSTGTYLDLSAGIKNCTVNQTVGVFDNLTDLYLNAIPSGLRERLDYQEQSVRFTVNQLVSRDWSLGGQYEISYAKLNDNYVDVPDTIILSDFQPRRNLTATLHRVGLFAIYNNPCGFFAKLDASWYAQNNQGYTPAVPGDNFWQMDAFAGYRFWHRKAELTFGVLNLTDQNYQLNPLNNYSELPRERTFLTQLKISF